MGSVRDRLLAAPPRRLTRYTLCDGTEIGIRSLSGADRSDWWIGNEEREQELRQAEGLHLPGKEKEPLPAAAQGQYNRFVEFAILRRALVDLETGEYLFQADELDKLMALDAEDLQDMLRLALKSAKLAPVAVEDTAKN